MAGNNSKPMDGQWFSIVDDPERAIRKLWVPGTYVAFEVYDCEENYLSYVDFREDISHYKRDGLLLYCLSLNDPDKLIYKLDLSMPETLARVRSFLEAFNIVKVTRKVAFISRLLHQCYEITLHAVIDLNAMSHLVTEGDHSTLKVPSTSINQTVDNIHRNMFNLVRVWLLLYRGLYQTLIDDTETELNIYRNLT